MFDGEKECGAMSLGPVFFCLCAGAVAGASSCAPGTRVPATQPGELAEDPILRSDLDMQEYTRRAVTDAVEHLRWRMRDGLHDVPSVPAVVAIAECTTAIESLQSGDLARTHAPIVYLGYFGHNSDGSLLLKVFLINANRQTAGMTLVGRDSRDVRVSILIDLGRKYKQTAIRDVVILPIQYVDWAALTVELAVSGRIDLAKHSDDVDFAVPLCADEHVAWSAFVTDRSGNRSNAIPLYRVDYEKRP